MRSRALRPENTTVATVLPNTGPPIRRQDSAGSGTPLRRTTLRTTLAKGGTQAARSTAVAGHGTLWCTGEHTN